MMKKLILVVFVLLDCLLRIKRKRSFDDENVHEKYKEELRGLRDEFERYKSRTNQLMKAKYNKVLLSVEKIIFLIII